MAEIYHMSAFLPLLCAVEGDARSDSPTEKESTNGTLPLLAHVAPPFRDLGVNRRRLGGACAVAVAAALAAATGAASATAGDDAHFKRPKLVHGLLSVEGTESTDAIALRLDAEQPDLLEIDVSADGVADFTFRRDRIANIVIAAAAGDDLVRIDDGNGAVTDGVPVTIDGGDGNDIIAGGRGVETLLGGDGSDSIDGNGGSDASFMGSGDDSFVWDPGDGSDTVEGDDGADTMVFNGAGVGEQVELSANGNRLRFFRNPGTITMDTNGVERIDFNALGGADVTTVRDLTATDVRALNVDLAGTLGSGIGDGQADRVVIEGTNGDDTVDVSGAAEGLKVSGLAVTARILHSEAANDRLDIDTLGGADTVDSTALAADAIQLFVDGLLVP